MKSLLILIIALSACIASADPCSENIKKAAVQAHKEKYPNAVGPNVMDIQLLNKDKGSLLYTKYLNPMTALYSVLVAEESQEVTWVVTTAQLDKANCVVNA